MLFPWSSNACYATRGRGLSPAFLQQLATDAPAVLYLHGSRWNLSGSVFRMARATASCPTP